MAGVKGRSGGPRKNAGGKRPGAGRKPKGAPHKLTSTTSKKEVGERQVDAIGGISDAKAFLEGVLVGTYRATADQIRAAQALLPFQHKKLGEGGKKDQRLEDASKVVGRFAPSPPRLAALGGRKV